MILLYFKADENPHTAKLSYTQREQLRQDKIIDHGASIDEWVKRSGLAIEQYSIQDKLVHVAEYFLKNYQLSNCFLKIYQNNPPKYVSENSDFYSYRNTLDDESMKNEINDIMNIMTSGVIVAIEHILEYYTRDIDFLPKADENPVWWWKRLFSILYQFKRDGKFADLSSYNKTSFDLSVSLIQYIFGRVSQYTDIAESVLDIELYTLEQIRNSFENYSYNIEKSGINKEELLKNFSLNNDKVKQAKSNRKIALIDIEKRERAEARRINREIEEHREKCKEFERVRDARMEAYDKACDKAGCALPWMF